jgi:hypothetical protein
MFTYVRLYPTLLNSVSIWVQNTAYWGTPLIEVMTNGDWSQDMAMLAILYLNTGYGNITY